MDQQTLQEVEQRIGYHFRNPSLLCEALSHSSQADTRLASNERMEFLGDAVLALFVCSTLFNKFPDYLEGDLTKIKSMLVSRKTCAKLSNKLGLREYVQVGKGMAQTRAMSGSIAAGTLEAVIAAVYLDGGIEAAHEFILRLWSDLIDKADANQHQENFKSILQQYAQQQFNLTPMYELLDEKGPDHNKCFEIGVVIDHRHFPSAWGMTKKDAEQKAARYALIELGQMEPDEDD
ncbi:MAG: ribonuclease III [Sedimentisphaerales bacterium]|nr:ribonuclease III [Sedimentisphaerales bacterium]